MSLLRTLKCSNARGGVSGIYYLLVNNLIAKEHLVYI